MNPESLRTLLQDWADHEARDQCTPLTPALLRCKLRLAQEDARRARLRRFQMALLVLPVLLGAALGVGQLSGLLHVMALLSPSAVGSLLAMVGLGALVAPTLAAE